MARTLKQIREQNALRSASLRLRRKDEGGEPVYVWARTKEHAKAIKDLAAKLKASSSESN